MAKVGGTCTEEHRRKVGEGVSLAWKRRKVAEGWSPKSPQGKLGKIAAILGTHDPVWAVQYLEQSHREICWRLQQCVQTHGLGLGGENIAELVCDKLDNLLGKSSKDYR